MRNFTQTTALVKRVTLCIVLLIWQPAYAESIEANAVHGSDAPETAAVEIAYFFP